MYINNVGKQFYQNRTLDRYNITNLTTTNNGRKNHVD